MEDVEEFGSTSHVIFSGLLQLERAEQGVWGPYIYDTEGKNRGGKKK